MHMLQFVIVTNDQQTHCIRFALMERYDKQGLGQGGPAAPQGPQDCKPSTLNFHILP